jgi:methylphosphotriester-DNA--protein-cysteine methyltransferase
MNTTGASVHITKLAAAERQLRAAIRLYFAEEDELAIHTVASAAYRLINDLKAARGMNEAADTHLASIFYVVRDFRRGTLPKHISENLELMNWVAEMAENLPITAESEIEDVKLHIGEETARAFWRKQNEASNFLKHADKDAQGHISLEKVDNFTLLLQAIGSYTGLARDELGPEGLVFWLYSSVRHGELESLPEKFKAIGTRLLEVHGTERLNLCHALIQELRERTAE